VRRWRQRPRDLRWTAACSHLLRRAQRLSEIVDDIRGRLDADREADQLLADPGLGELVGIHLLMGGRGGMNDQRLGIADIGEMADQLQALDELAARGPAALDAERDDGAG